MKRGGQFGIGARRTHGRAAVPLPLMAFVRAGGCAASAYGVCPRWRLCRFRLWRLSALARRCVLLFSWDRELYAGAAFVPAGCSSGTGVCARGGWSAGRCGAVGRSCVRSCLLLRFCRRVLHSLTPAMRQRAAFCALLTAGRLLTPRFVLFHACHTVLLECLALVHACLFSFIRKKETACGMFRFCSAWSESPFVGSHAF